MPLPWKAKACGMLLMGLFWCNLSFAQPPQEKKSKPAAKPKPSISHPGLSDLKFKTSKFKKQPSNLAALQSPTNIRRYPLRIGSQEFQVELAIRELERQRGLQYRLKLPEKAGMLFFFETPRRASFWMDKVSLKLDLGYFDAEGKLLQIIEAQPHNTATFESKSDKIVYVLELNRGVFTKYGIKLGDRIDLKGLTRSIQIRRGLFIENTGLID